MGLVMAGRPAKNRNWKRFATQSIPNQNVSRVLDTTDEYPKDKTAVWSWFEKVNSFKAWISSSRACETDKRQLQALLISFSSPCIFSIALSQATSQAKPNQVVFSLSFKPIGRCKPCQTKPSKARPCIHVPRQGGFNCFSSQSAATYRAKVGHAPEPTNQSDLAVFSQGKQESWLKAGKHRFWWV